jgi:hypothetical protein
MPLRIRNCAVLFPTSATTPKRDKAENGMWRDNEDLQPARPIRKPCHIRELHREKAIFSVRFVTNCETQNNFPVSTGVVFHL